MSLDTADAKPNVSTVRRLFTHGGVYSAALLTNQALAIVLLPLYARKLDSEGLGIIEITNMARRVLMFVFLQGLSTSWFRLRVLHKTEEERRTFEAGIVWYLVGSCTLLIGVLALLGDHVWRFVTPGLHFYPLGLITAVTAALSMFPMLLERSLQARNQVARLALFSVGRALLTMLTIVYFVVSLRRGAPGKVEAELLAAGVIAVWSFAWIRPAAPTHVRKDQLKQALAYGIPQTPQGITTILNDMIDRLVVGAALGLAAVGVYSVGYRVASLPLLLMSSLQQAFAPLFTDDMQLADEKREAGDTAGANVQLEHIARAGLGMVALSCILALGVTATGREVITIMAPKQADGAWPVLAPVSLGVVGWTCHRIFSQSIFYHLSAARLVVVIGLIGAATNVVFNMLLIPPLGIMGAAWATLLSNAAFGVLSYRIGMHYAHVPYALGRWAGMFAWTCVNVAVFHFCDASAMSMWHRVSLKGITLLVALGGTMWLSGLTLETLRTQLRR